jgi:hypothetical protein
MLPRHRSSLALAALLAASLPAWAASATASSASDSASSAASSTSNSIRRSSDGSSRATGVAQGDYRVIEVAAVPGEPAQRRVKLQAEATVGQPADDDNSFWLQLPETVLATSGVGPGQQVQVKQRAHGLAFARAADGEAFFLVLDDAWLRELPGRPVTL